MSVATVSKVKWLLYTRLIFILKMSNRCWDTLASLSRNIRDGNPWPMSHARGCPRGDSAPRFAQTVKLFTKNLGLRFISRHIPRDMCSSNKNSFFIVDSFFSPSFLSSFLYKKKRYPRPLKTGTESLKGRSNLSRGLSKSL